MALVEALFVGSVLLAMLSLLFVGWKSPEIVVFLALVFVWNAGTVSTEDALSGFSNPGVLAVGSLFVVIKGVERSRLADRAAKHVFGLRTSFTAGLLRLMCLAFLLSAFLNNTPVVALLIPITKDWARTRGFSPAVLLMPLSFACIFGGLVTIIGTSTNLVVQGLVLEEDLAGLGFFEPGYIGLPLGLLGMLYLTVAAPRVLARGGGGGGGGVAARGGGGGSGGGGGDREGGQDQAEWLLTEVQVSRDFEHLGKTVAVVLACLGLPVEALTKLKRRSAAAVPSTTIPVHEAIQTDDDGACRARTGSFTSENNPGCRKRSGEGWGSKVDGSPLSSSSSAAAAASQGANGSGKGSPLVRRRPNGSDDGVSSASTAASKPQHQARARGVGRGAFPHRLDPPVGERPFLEDNHGGSGQRRQSWKSDADNLETLCPVSPSEPLQDGDVLVLSCPVPTMVSFQGSVLSEGVRGLGIWGAEPAVAAAVAGAAAAAATTKAGSFFEVVLSDCNHLVGCSPAGKDDARLASRYGCRIVAVRHAASSAAAIRTGGTGDGGEEEEEEGVGVSMEEGGRAKLDGDRCSPSSPLGRGGEDVGSPFLAGKKPQAAGSTAAVRATPCPTASTTGWAAAEGDRGQRGAVEPGGRPLAAGDTLLVLAKDGFSDVWKAAPEFDLVSRVGAVPAAVATYDYLSLLVFCGMLGWVLFSSVAMVRAAFAAGGILIVGGWVDAKKSVGYVDWSLLLLVGSALGLSKAIANSGLAGYAGNAIRESGMSASASLYLLYGFTMVCTELITNNAAAALAVPIALSIAKELEASHKPFVLTVMMAASSSFITPIGYQTNTMVWGPGGYKFSDFVRLGTPLSLIYMVVGSFLMPRLFPF